MYIYMYAMAKLPILKCLRIRDGGFIRFIGGGGGGISKIAKY